MYDSWPQVHWEQAHEVDEEFKKGSEIIGEYLFHSNGSCDAATDAVHALMCRAKLITNSPTINGRLGLLSY